MKKTVTLLTGFLLAASMLKAQQKQSRFLAELSVGPSFPVGKFGDKSFDIFNRKNPPLRAKTGLGVNFSLGYYLNRSVGVLLSSGYSVNEQSWSGYQDYLRNIPSIDYLPVETSGKSWKVAKVMGGGFFVVPLTAAHKLNLLTRLTAGVCKTAVPGYDYKVYTWDGRLFREGSTDKIDLPWTFCYQMSVALQYKLTNRLHVLLDVNSFNATAKKTVTYFDGYTNEVTTKYELNTLNAMAGVGLNF
jgi:hypothetical protein